MKLGEIVVHMGNYNFTKFHKNQMKNKKVLLIARFSVPNFKVSVESLKSYIVTWGICLYEQEQKILVPNGASALFGLISSTSQKI